MINQDSDKIQTVQPQKQIHQQVKQYLERHSSEEMKNIENSIKQSLRRKKYQQFKTTNQIVNEFKQRELQRYQSEINIVNLSIMKMQEEKKKLLQEQSQYLQQSKAKEDKKLQQMQKQESYQSKILQLKFENFISNQQYLSINNSQYKNFQKQIQLKQKRSQIKRQKEKLLNENRLLLKSIQDLQKRKKQEHYFPKVNFAENEKIQNLINQSVHLQCQYNLLRQQYKKNKSGYNHIGVSKIVPYALNQE